MLHNEFGIGKLLKAILKTHILQFWNNASYQHGAIDMTGKWTNFLKPRST